MIVSCYCGNNHISICGGTLPGARARSASASANAQKPHMRLQYTHMHIKQRVCGYLSGCCMLLLRSGRWAEKAGMRESKSQCGCCHWDTHWGWTLVVSGVCCCMVTAHEVTTLSFSCWCVDPASCFAAATPAAQIKKLRLGCVRTSTMKSWNQF